MEKWLLEFLNDYGYMGMMCLMAIENIFPPIPSEVILTFGGFMTSTSNLTIFGIVLSATSGSVVGAIMLYMIGMQLDVERLEKLIHKYGSWLRLSTDDVYRAHGWFERYGTWTVFICRFVPLMRSLISIPAGMSHMHLGSFLVLTILGTLIWNSVLVYLGALLGASWSLMVMWLEMYAKIVYLGLAILGTVCVILFLKKRFLS